MIKIILLTLIFNVQAASLIRLDNIGIEEITPFSHKYELIIEDNCAFCLTQLSILKECVDHKDVIVFINNKNKLTEEQLQRLVRKKKLSFKTYILDEDFKQKYEFTGVTPKMWINKDKKKNSFIGVVSCEKLKA